MSATTCKRCGLELEWTHGNQRLHPGCRKDKKAPTGLHRRYDERPVPEDADLIERKFKLAIKRVRYDSAIDSRAQTST